jgi:hypothetical protein
MRVGEAEVRHDGALRAGGSQAVAWCMGRPRQRASLRVGFFPFDVAQGLNDERGRLQVCLQSICRNSGCREESKGADSQAKLGGHKVLPYDG